MQRARACWIVEPGRAELREEQLPAPGSDEVLVRTLYTGISRGTESLVFAGRVPVSEYQRMRAPAQEGEFPGPVKYGYINVGQVEEGPQELVGQTIFCLYPHQSCYVVPASACTPVPAEVPAERAVLGAGMETALNVLWDAEPTLGDRIAVIGAGVIGCLCAYLAARIPGTQVQLVDTCEERRAIAEALGCDFAGPTGCLSGADLVIHASGTGAGLATALGAAGQEARVVELSWYGDRPVELPLGQGFHAQRLQIVSSQVGSIPARQRARWSYQRRLATALLLLSDPALDALISGESRFAELPAALAEIAARPGPLCHRIRYPAAGS